MTLPLETINGKQYQPVEGVNNLDDCDKCALDGVCNEYEQGSFKCTEESRWPGKAVYFIEPGDTNEQE